MTKHGRKHTDGSRSGGQPVVITRKAHTAVLEVLAEWGIEPSSATAQQLTIATTEALCRAIEQHEAFRQKVSDDAKPDPLVDVLLEAFPDYNLGNNLFHLPYHAERFRKAIAKRDGKIVWEQGE